jgi:branched-chain amino acid transport system ATP-binding protein
LAAAERTVLRVENVSVRYGGATALTSVSLQAYGGNISLILGSNGSGKTSLMKAIMGTVALLDGQIKLCVDGVTLALERMTPFSRAQAGIRMVHESGDLFDRLSVLENLHIGAYTRKNHSEIDHDVQTILSRFPLLYERKRQLAGNLSGGERRLLSIARATMGRPHVIMLDEPSSGLGPEVFRQVLEYAACVAREGVVIVISEQNAADTLESADRMYLLDHGQIVRVGDKEHPLSLNELGEAYLPSDRSS